MSKTKRHDDLGDRLKGYERAETDRRFDPSLPVYARLDGRSFSNFTRGMKRPYDISMYLAMANTAKALVKETHPRICYTQSDEISLVWQITGKVSQMMFDGKVMKMASVLAGLASVHFFKAVADSEYLSRFSDRMPHFDCRVLQVPSRTEAANMILWREIDATKNAVSMAARAHFSARALHLKDQTAMRAMMAEKGIDFDAYPTWFRRGTFLRRVTAMRPLNENELARIPEKHRPALGALVERSSVERIEMPSFRTVANREAVIFDGEAPILIGERKAA